MEKEQRLINFYDRFIKKYYSDGYDIDPVSEHGLMLQTRNSGIFEELLLYVVDKEANTGLRDDAVIINMWDKDKKGVIDYIKTYIQILEDVIASGEPNVQFLLCDDSFSMTLEDAITYFKEHIDDLESGERVYWN